MSTCTNSQLFLVVNEMKEVMQSSSNRPVTIRPGSVAVTRSHNDDHGELMLEIHHGDQPRGIIRRCDLSVQPFRTITTIILQGGLPQDKVISITGQEFNMLLAVDNDDDRLELHTSGRLKWACGLKAGDAVQVQLTKKSEPVAGVIRGSGTHQLSRSRYGLQFVVEIVDEVFEHHFGDKGEHKKKFLCTKNCGIFVSVEKLTYHAPLQQNQAATCTKAATSGEIRQTEVATTKDGRPVKIEPSVSGIRVSSTVSLREILQEVVQQYESMNEQVQHLKSEVRAKVDRLSASEAEIEKLHDELRQKQEEISTTKKESDQQLRDQQQQHEQTIEGLIQQNEDNLHVKEQQQRQEQLQLRVAQLQQELQEMKDQKQQILARIDTAFAYMKGDPGTSQVGFESKFDTIELWEIPREDVHVSNKILGTGGWGYVAEGTFCGQKVAVKCLHRGILSQNNTDHVRREISIMAQVRHPNLVLLIGAVLNADTSPLIITELLDQTLRSAYQDHLLKEHCKLPILRDIAAALNYLHSHRCPIIHRDVSSANVLLEAVCKNIWRAKLSDFGSANLISAAITPAEGAVIYAAPEVRTEARNQQTPKVDVYSFGVLLCEISLCQFPPDPGAFAAFLASLQDNADPGLYVLAQNCTKREPEERPSMSDVLTQIGELIPVE